MKNSKDKPKKQGISLPTSTQTETTYDIVATVVELVPWIGGAVSNVLAGMSMNRKIGRIETCLKFLSERVEDVRSEKAENFVKTEDFEDLLEQTLKKVADERNEEKRILYGRFLLNNIAMPEVDFEERSKMLRILEGLDPAHVELIKAFLQIPTPRDSRGHWGSSIIRTLSSRLPNYSEERIIELVNDLEQLGLTADLAGSLKTLMTSDGAVDLRSRVTALGRRFVDFLGRE